MTEFSAPRTRDGRLEFVLGTGLVVAALLLGGGTRPGFLSDSIVQLLSVAVLVLFALRRGGGYAAPSVLSGAAPSVVSGAGSVGSAAGAGSRNSLRWGGPGRLPLILAVLVAAIISVALVPLPPAIWGSLPDRQAIVRGFAVIGLQVPWRPLSIDAEATWLALAATLPPLAVLVSVCSFTSRERRWLTAVVLAVAAASVVIGLLQLAQGPSSSLRFFDYTNPTEAVGFFANRNHFSAFLNVALVLAAAFLLSSVMVIGQQPATARWQGPLLLSALAGVVLIVMLLAGQTMARSRAGLGMTIVALVGAFALAVPEYASGRHRLAVRLLGAAILVALMLAVQFSLYRVLDRFGADPLLQSRLPFTRNTLAMIWAGMPFGFGAGTFVPVYAMHEPVGDVMTGLFVNRAHNDLMEFWFEHGVLAWVVGVPFVVWLVGRSFVVWRSRATGNELDHALSRAATLVIAILLAHSSVDYPLRTSALMCVFALATAFLVPAPLEHDEIRVVASRQRRHRRHRPAVDDRAPPVVGAGTQRDGGGIGAPLGPVASSSVVGPAGSSAWPAGSVGPAGTPGEQWGRDVEWPDEWRNSESSEATGPSRSSQK